MRFIESDFTIPEIPKQLVAQIRISASAPSNIALVKYWGKQGLQLPMNPSVSFTLNRSKTLTTADLTALNKASKQVLFKFYFDQKHYPDFEPKIAGFFKNI